MSLSFSSDSNSLHQRIRKLLKQEIINNYRAGDRLEGSRVLSHRLKVSRWTINSALELLVQEGLLESRPYRGFFVRPRVVLNKNNKNQLLFILPDGAISEEKMGFSDWNRLVEFQAGLYYGARKHNFELVMLPTDKVDSYVNTHYSSGNLAVISRNPISHQLSELFIHRQIPCVFVTGYPGLVYLQNGFFWVSYDREGAIRKTAEFLIQSGVRSVGFICPHPAAAVRAARIKFYLEAYGVKTDPSWIYIMTSDKIDDVHAALRAAIPADKSQLPECIYCDRMIYPLALLRLIYERNWCLGKDLGVMAFTCLTAIQSICPELTYTKIPYYDMAATACDTAAEILEKPSSIKSQSIILESEIVIGSSISLSKQTKT